MCTFSRESTLGMSREQWQEARNKSIGGSDAAAIVNLNPWKTAYTLWTEKTGKVIPEDISGKESVRLGVELEDYVARRFTERTGKKVRRENAILRNSAYPWAHANVDRMVVGERAGLECKTTSTLNLKRFKGGEFPSEYYCQCVHYLAITGYDRWYLAVLVLGREFYTYTIERDQSEIDSLMAAEKEFWTMVESGNPPGFTGAESEEKTLETLYGPETDPGMIDLVGMDSALRRYQEAAAQIKHIKSVQDRAKLELCEAIGKMSGGWVGATKITWKPQSRSTFQTDRFRAEHPEINLDKYYKTTTSRVFRVSAAEKK